MKQPLMTAICVNAATGKMGQQIIHEIIASEQAELCAAICRSGHPYFNKIVRGSSNLIYSNDIAAGLSASQVVIDFSLPTVSLALLDKSVVGKTPLLIGTTGFSPDQFQQIEQASQEIPILWAPNTSIGVNVTISLIAKAAAMLGQQANIEIIDSHHKHKLDAPSGTALKMGEAICEATHTSLRKRAVFQRYREKKPRSDQDIGFSVIRAGEIIGEHKVVFALDNETISIEHKAQNRRCFAEGAVKAAIWLSTQQNGLYHMQDFIG